MTISGSGSSTLIRYPSSAVNNTDSFRYKISDGQGGLAIGTATITINNNVTGQQTAQISLNAGHPMISFFGVPGYHYVLQRSYNNPNNFTDVTDVTAASVTPSGTGMSANGSWTLFLADLSGGDGANVTTLNGSSLDVTAVSEPVNESLSTFAGLIGSIWLGRWMMNRKKSHLVHQNGMKVLWPDSAMDICSMRETANVTNGITIPPANREFIFLD